MMRGYKLKITGKKSMNITEQEIIEQSNFAQPQTTEEMIEELAGVILEENIDLPIFDSNNEEVIKEFLEPENVSDQCSIYLLTNTKTKKIYIGQTWAFPVEERMGRNGNKYANSPYLYASIQKHGIKAFTYIVLAQTPDQNIADQLEAEYIIQYNAKDHEKGYNIKDGGRGGKHSQISKEKISTTLKSHFATMTTNQIAERVRGIIDWWKNKKRGPHTEERKKDIAQKMVIWHTENEHPMLGKHHTDDAKAAISAGLLGKKKPLESVQRGAQKRRMPIKKEMGIIQDYKDGKIISEIEKTWNTGRASIYRLLKNHNIVRERENNNWTGKTHTEETKKKQSEARAKYWEDKRNSK